MILALLYLVITNLSMKVELPVNSRCDWASITCFMTGDSRTNFYGVTLESLDALGEPLTSGWVSESYVPPAWEQVIIPLPVETRAVRYTIWGPRPHVDTIASMGRLTIFVTKPSRGKRSSAKGNQW